ncbi:serine kinase [Salipaludibacillus keqinensis]|uniref:Serine kinase n=1 Tax=Salipaludibacillus keqinensis TaxID=2045207 RepID=A0A323TGL8_9BACI|nr:phosphotransferase [Salipaludibacillus keqinensis]PYZ93416.1 serine kinase [Salipaludibacillus keqinensis]
MKGIDVLHRFGFDAVEDPESIYPFSPVYRVNDTIVKRTQRPIERASRLMNYTRMLKVNGVNVVTPVELSKPNPQSMGEHTYVVYPFVEGNTYKGEDHEIFQAGRLLGQIHRLSYKGNPYQLEKYDVYDFTKEEVIESVRKIEENAAEYAVNHNQLKEKLLRIVRQQSTLEKSELPHVATPHDYKANNLIFTPKPYLIDPDNAAWVPRIFDLALVLLLFHNELSTAPDEMFTPDQWQQFLAGYKKSITFTDMEIASWSMSLEHVFLDEVMWLMAEGKEDWVDPAQRKLFESLLTFIADSSAYPLD